MSARISLSFEETLAEHIGKWKGKKDESRLLNYFSINCLQSRKRESNNNKAKKKKEKNIGAQYLSWTSDHAIVQHLNLSLHRSQYNSSAQAWKIECQYLTLRRFIGALKAMKQSIICDALKCWQDQSIHLW